jgi:hypothetical protein
MVLIRVIQMSSTGVTLKSMADCVVGGSRSREKLLLGFNYFHTPTYALVYILSNH